MTLSRSAWFAIAALVAGIGIFTLLAIEISAGRTVSFDRNLLLAMRRPDGAPLGTPGFQQMARDISALGSTNVLALATILAVGFLAIDRKGRLALFLCGCVVAGHFLDTTLKNAFDRARPDLVPRIGYFSGASFPSGHALLSAITYFSLATVAAQLYRRKTMTIYVYSSAAIVVALIGVTRVYLGVHWPTDVLAGWIGGGVWALLYWSAALRVYRGAG
ncbi:MAG TPA: phosphatase PAP2 family protein [Bryobacteraceae bacterium]|jgi:undecaprenyl-diphosphatase